MSTSGWGVSYREGTWVEPASRLKLAYRVWQPAAPRALLIVVHGFGEHGGRYHPFAQALAAEGIWVAAPDLPGHGLSAGRRGDLASVAHCAAAVGTLATEVFSRESGYPRYTLFGHSFGGLVAMAMAFAPSTHPATAGLARLVLQSPLLETGFPIPAWKTLAAKLLARWWPTCALPMNLDVGLLSRDPAVGRAYRADPLVHNAMSARAYGAILQAAEEAFRRAATLRAPLLLLCGGDDRIISLDAARRWFSLVPCEKRISIFPNAYHELHHEAVQGEVVRLIRDWTLMRSSSDGRGDGEPG